MPNTYRCWAEHFGEGAALIVEEHGDAQAAEKYVERQHHALDHPTEVIVVIEFGLSKVRRRFRVEVASVPYAVAHRLVEVAGA